MREILSAIQTTDVTKPGVPLTPIRFYVLGGVEVDLTNPNDTTAVDDVTLAPGQEVTFAWVLDALDANTDLTVDDSTDLEFTPLVLGALRGKNVLARGEAEFHAIDRPLLEWGVRPKDGRTSYPSGQVARVSVLTEPVSAGQVRLVILDQVALQTPGGFFRPGDRVVINPGVREIKS